MQWLRWVGSAVFVSALLVTGCGARKQSAPAAAAQSDKTTAVAAADGSGKVELDTTYICSYERPTGSNIPVRVCRSLRQIEEKKAETQQEMDRIRAGRVAPSPGGGGQ